MNKKMDYKEILRTTWKSFGYMKGKRVLFLVGGVLALGKLVISFLIPYLYEQLMNLTNQGADYAGILKEVWPVFLGLILLIPFVAAGSYWQRSGANWAVSNMQKAVFRHTMRMPLQALETDRADKVLRATANVESAASIFSGYTMTWVFKFIIYFFGALGVLLFTSWRYALLGLALSALMFWLATGLNIRLRQLEQRALAADASLGAKLLDLVGNLPVVKLFGLESQLGGRYGEDGEEAYRCRLQYKTMQGVTEGALDFLAYGSQALAILLGLWALWPAGDFAGLVYAASMLNLMLSGVRELGTAVMFIQKINVNANRVYELLDQPEEPGALPQSIQSPDFSGDEVVAFKDVWFSYLPGKPVLRGVSFTIRRGSMTALVGGSGSGKSTVLGLLLGFYKPDRGEIFIGGVPTSALSREQLRRCFSYIPQDAQLSAGSIKENVLLGAAPDEAQLEKALREAALTLPPDTQAGEGGGSLSGGERQRVSIARALYRDAPVFLLDEATSALDNVTEKAVQETIETALVGKTRICIAHRLNTIEQADQVITLCQGEVTGVTGATGVRRFLKKA